MLFKALFVFVFLFEDVVFGLKFVLGNVMNRKDSNDSQNFLWCKEKKLPNVAIIFGRCAMHCLFM